MFSGTGFPSSSSVFCQFCMSSRAWVTCRCLIDSDAIIPNFCVPKFQVTICKLRWTQGSPLCHSFWKAECLKMMPSWCRQVKWGNCGIPWVNCAVLCVKDDWKDSSEACAIACQNCAAYSAFPSGMTSHNKIAQFNWECIAPFTEQRFYSLATVEESLNTADGVKKLLRSVDTYPPIYVTS
jgi:hypothetical protein